MNALLNSAKARLIIGGVFVLAVVTIVLWTAILSPRMARSAEVNEFADSAETANLSQLVRLNELKKMALDAPTAASRVQKLLARMPQQAELPQLFDQISAAARSAGIATKDISAITPSVPVPLDDPLETSTGAVSDAQQSAAQANVRVARLDVTTSVAGTLKQIENFAKNIEALDRDFLITGLSISGASGEASNKHVGTIKATTFVLQSQLPDLVAEVNKLLADARVQTSTTQ